MSSSITSIQNCARSFFALKIRSAILRFYRLKTILSVRPNDLSAQKLQNINSDVLPLMFIRCGSLRQMLELGNKLGRALHLFAGFVFPKFSMLNAEHYLDTLTKLSQESGIVLYGMPIFETPDLLAMETRAKALQELKSTLGFYQDIIRYVGATDLCGLYGLRRKPETPIYDILVISDFIKDIVNYSACNS